MDPILASRAHSPSRLRCGPHHHRRCWRPGLSADAAAIAVPAQVPRDRVAALPGPFPWAAASPWSISTVSSGRRTPLHRHSRAGDAPRPPWADTRPCPMAPST